MYSKQLGGSLIEVMVALVILSMGSLGMISMQVTSLQQSNNAYLRTQATIKAGDILDRMRANPNAIDDYFNATGTANSSCWSWQGNAAGCDAQTLASADLHNWQTLINSTLPSGGGRVCRSDFADDQPGIPDCESATSDHPIAVYIWWQSSRDPNASPEMLAMTAEIE